jgi:GDPmannose 4,6-dehydratase
VTGQDGSYLAEFLLKKGYRVHGLRRRSSTYNLDNIKDLINNRNFFLHYGDLTDPSNLNKLILKIKPNEIYNLAAQSHVRLSFDIPEYTAVVNSIGCLNLLEAMVNHSPKAKFYQASTSELYGDRKKDIYLNENSSFNPCSPYATSKLYSFHLIKNYRERGFFTCNGILFNHESPRRGNTFVTKKIVESALKIINKKQKCLYIGNLYAKRDWGYAKEYVASMWKMLQQKKADDYVIATGKNYSVKYFIDKVFKNLGINLKWKNKGVKEIGINTKDKKIIVRVDPFYFRPTEVRTLKGDFKKAKRILKWKPKVNLDNLIKIMLTEERKKY